MLHIGRAGRSITPSRPVMLQGQWHVRVATQASDPVTVTAIAMETPEDRALMVSCDFPYIVPEVQEQVRAARPSRRSSFNWPPAAPRRG